MDKLVIVPVDSVESTSLAKLSEELDACCNAWRSRVLSATIPARIWACNTYRSTPMVRMS